MEVLSSDRESTRATTFLGVRIGMLYGVAVLLVSMLAPKAALGLTRSVDGSNGSCNDGTGIPVYCTIQAAIDAAAASDTILVAAGTYAENLILTKQLTLQGAQAVVGACNRSASETVVTAAGTVLALQTGSAGSIIDGFTFSGGNLGIETQSGPIDSLQLLNNRIVGFTGSGIFLNDSGIDVTVSGNEVDGSSQSASGAVFHLDQDNFDGLHVTSNCILNGGTRTGLFVDGNHTIGISASRSPTIDGNLFRGNATGANLGRFAFEFGTISDNVFANNGFDGLQGGIQNSSITRNRFIDNGRSGLALTGFGGSGDATRGAKDNTISQNCFIRNLSEGVFFSSSQFPGTIATNTLNQNNIFGNAAGAAYSGSEGINAENNWWGCATGANTAGCDTTTGTGAANIDTVPFQVDFVPTSACCAADANCDDSLICNGSETCDPMSNTCGAGTPPVCGLGGADPQCNSPACVDPGGCTVQPLPDNTSCDDGVFCSLPDSCQSGVCVAQGGGDFNNNGICDADDPYRPAPTASGWGLVSLCALLMTLAYRGLRRTSDGR
jgi:hypothetical protein